MALSYTDINTTPENLGDNNLLHILGYNIPLRGSLIQTYIEKPFNIQVPRDTNPPTFKTEQVNPILSEQSFFAQGLFVSDLTALKVDGTIPWTTLLEEELPRNQKRVTRAVTVPDKGSLVQVYMQTGYTENGKPKLTMAPEKIYWADGTAISGPDILWGASGSGPHFAEIWANENLTPTVLPVLNAWTLFEGFSQNGSSFGATPDHTLDKITINRPGSYMLNMSLGVLGGSSGVYDLVVFKNDLTPFPNLFAEIKLNASGDIRSFSISGIIDLLSLDFISLFIQQTGGILTNPTVKHVTMSVVDISG